MGETTQPRLRVSKKEAGERIKKQVGRGLLLCNQAGELLRIGASLSRLPGSNFPHFGSTKEEKFKSIIELSKRWSRDNEVLLDHLFNSTVISENDYTIFSVPQDKPHTIKGVTITPDLMNRINSYVASMDSSINSLKGIYGRLHLYDELPEMSQHASTNKEVLDNPSPSSPQHVFIVHGRDDESKYEVALFVKELGLNDIILDRQPDEGVISILDKFEREAKKADFAIALLTPDDVGALKSEADTQLKPRPRQNVSFELGYFISALGREKVCLLIKGEIENPSDLDGMLYKLMDGNEWKLKVAQDMLRAGLSVDLKDVR